MTRTNRLVLGLVGLVVWSCGGSSPVTQTPVTTTPPTTAKPAPTPTPEATFECPLPELPENDDCEESAKYPAQFYQQVLGAIGTLRTEKPNFFNDKEIVQVNKYLDGLVRILGRDYGLCAQRSGQRDEISIKSENSFAEHWDVIAAGRDPGTSYVNWTYVATCKPADF